MKDIDKKSLEKAKRFFETTEYKNLEVGTTKGLEDIHKYIFNDLYKFAGEIRTTNISKGNFRFVNALYLKEILNKIDTLEDNTLDEIITKYVEMNMAHPFLEGNGRATRIWLDVILMKRKNKIVDWGSIDKILYLQAMERSPVNTLEIKSLIENKFN